MTWFTPIALSVGLFVWWPLHILPLWATDPLACVFFTALCISGIAAAFARALDAKE